MSLRHRLGEYRRLLAKTAAAEDQPGMRAWLHFLLFDHGILRVFWTNLAEVAPGVYRANQPSPRRLDHYARMGIRTIVNLRGISEAPHYTFEKTACARLGLTMIDIPGLSARRAPEASALLDLIDVMRQAERPFLLHCKSGADRSALAAASYLLAVKDAPVTEARRHFSIWYVHLKWTRTGVLDHILDAYALAQQETGIGFEDWLRNVYDPAIIQAEFEDQQR